MRIVGHGGKDSGSSGGADDPGNMQWQTKEDAKAKDKWVRKGC